MAAAMRADTSGALPEAIAGISIDSRSLGRGDAFFAIQGDARDGHDFVDAALKAGAGLAVVSAKKRGQFAQDVPLLVVPDVLEALIVLARASRARSKAKFIGVTGSVGKTGTKEALKLALSSDGETHASAASYNNHWGVPLSLARCPESARYAVLEMGMNHAGEIAPLTKLVRPHAAIVTTVEPVHLEFFPSVEAIADAKGEIFEGLLPGGAAIIKYDNPYARRLVATASRFEARPVTFGFDSHADVRGSDFRPSDDGSDFTVYLGGRTLSVHLATPGRHIAENALAVAAALDAVGTDVARGLGALSDLTPPNGRGSRSLLCVGGGQALLIDESYNANPASMKAALATLGAVARETYARRIAVLGDMLELGNDSPALHAGLKGAIDAAGVDLVFACGPQMKGLYDALPAAMKGGYSLTSSSIETTLADHLRAGDVVMVKASNGTRLGAVVAALKSRFGKDGPAA